MVDQDKLIIIKEWKPLGYKYQVDLDKVNISRDQDSTPLEYKNQMEDQVKLNIIIKKQVQEKECKIKQIGWQNIDHKLKLR